MQSAEYNVPALLEQLRGKEPLESNQPGEESLNAGSELPGDVLCSEVEVDIKSIIDLIPEETETDREIAALESRHTELSYLREDIVSARGMTQALAIEAIAIKPDFGGGKPIGYYSKHASQTRYVAALEEIDTTMMRDAIFYLDKVNERINRLDSSAQGVCSKISDEWEKLRWCAGVFAHDFSSGVQMLAAVGVDWNDDEMITLAIDTYAAPGETAQDLRAYLKNTLCAGTGRLQSIYDKGMEYQAGNRLALYLDQFSAYAIAWNDELATYTEALKSCDDNDLPKFVIPPPPKFSLPKGEVASADVLQSRLREFSKQAEDYDNVKNRPDSIAMMLRGVGDSVYYSSLPEVFPRTIDLTSMCEKYRGTLGELIAYLTTLDPASDKVSLLVTDLNKFSTKLSAMFQLYNYLMDAVSDYVHYFRQAAKALIAAVMVVVEAADLVLTKRAPPPLQQDADAMNVWKDHVALMRQSASFLC